MDTALAIAAPVIVELFVFIAVFLGEPRRKYC